MLRGWAAHTLVLPREPLKIELHSAPSF